MIAPQFIDYIKRQLAAGIAQEDIKRTLRINGLSEQDVVEAFTVAGEASPAATIAPAASPVAIAANAPTVVAPVVSPTSSPVQTPAPAAAHNEEVRPQSVLYFE